MKRLMTLIPFIAAFILMIAVVGTFTQFLAPSLTSIALAEGHGDDGGGDPGGDGGGGGGAADDGGKDDGGGSTGGDAQGDPGDPVTREPWASGPTIPQVSA